MGQVRSCHPSSMAEGRLQWAVAVAQWKEEKRPECQAWCYCNQSHAVKLETEGSVCPETVPPYQSCWE